MTSILLIPPREELFTPNTLAKYLSVSERHVRELLQTGVIPSYTIGRVRRIKPEDVDSYLETRREETA